ncbi:MAG: extensin, partial [Methylocella sp.]
SPSARIPDAYFAAAAHVPSARAYAPVPPEPVRGSLREDGAFVPEGQPSDWDLTPSSPGR